jgi:hypothetical protein
MWLTCGVGSDEVVTQKGTFDLGSESVTVVSVIAREGRVETAGANCGSSTLRRVQCVVLRRGSHGVPVDGSMLHKGKVIRSLVYMSFTLAQSDL